MSILWFCTPYHHKQVLIFHAELIKCFKILENNITLQIVMFEMIMCYLDSVDYGEKV